MILQLDGFPYDKTTGQGLIFDAKTGLVLVSRATVSHGLCDIRISVAKSVVLPGQVIFMHPTDNYAVVQFDRSLVKAPIRRARFSKERIERGQNATFVGFDGHSQIVVSQTTVTTISTVSVPENTYAPQYRAVNVDGVSVAETGLSSESTSGVLLQKNGTVQALWMNYIGPEKLCYGWDMATTSLLPILHSIKKDKISNLRFLNAEFVTVEMSAARTRGVGENWVTEVARVNPTKHQLLMVWKLNAPSLSSTQEALTLKSGDIILTLNGKLVTQAMDLDMVCSQEVLDVLIVRDGKETRLKVHTSPMEDLETNRALKFCGALFQKPHLAIHQRVLKIPSEIYVSHRVRSIPFHTPIPT